MKIKEIKKLDTMWSIAIKERDNFTCVNCGGKTFLNSHHIISRIVRATRWELMNGLCLCAGCHKFNLSSIHNNPLVWESKLETLISKRELLRKSKRTKVLTYEYVKTRLFNRLGL